MNEKLISLTQNAQPNDRQNQLKNQANNTTYDWRVHGLYQKKIESIFGKNHLEENKQNTISRHRETNEKRSVQLSSTTLEIQQSDTGDLPLVSQIGR